MLFGDGGDGQGVAAAMRPGSVFVMCSTVDPNVSIAFERRLEALGLLYVDAPISGGAAKAASGEMTVMGAARDAAWAMAEPLPERDGRPRSTASATAPATAAR